MFYSVHTVKISIALLVLALMLTCKSDLTVRLSAAWRTRWPPLLDSHHQSESHLRVREFRPHTQLTWSLWRKLLEPEEPPIRLSEIYSPLNSQLSSDGARGWSLASQAISWKSRLCFRRSTCSCPSLWSWARLLFKSAPLQLRPLNPSRH